MDQLKQNLVIILLKHSIAIDIGVILRNIPLPTIIQTIE